MTSNSVNILITLAAILISYGITIFVPNEKTKIIAIGVGFTIIFWVWLLDYANHRSPQLIEEIKPANNADKPAITSPRLSRGIVILDSQDIKVYDNEVNGADEGYVSERNKNIEFKNNKHTAPKTK